MRVTLQPPVPITRPTASGETRWVPVHFEEEEAILWEEEDQMIFR
jgi:hypothetical protein